MLDIANILYSGLGPLTAMKQHGVLEEAKYHRPT